MELNLETTYTTRAHSILAALVAPRPIAWVTTLNPDGSVNAAPFSFFNLLGDDPPILGFCPADRPSGKPKDTALNIRRTREFVVNLVDEGTAQAMNVTAAAIPYGESELTLAGLTSSTSSVVTVPRIAEVPASLECTEWGTLQIGGNRLIIGLIRRVHVRDDLFDPVAGRIITERFFPVARIGGPDGYSTTRDRFSMLRPCASSAAAVES